MPQLSDVKSLFTDANLQGYWKLESDGTDSGPNGYNLTPQNTPTFVAGKYGNAVDLESTLSQFLNIADASCANLEISGNKTISAWVNPESLATNNSIVMKSDVTTATAFGLQISATNKVKFNSQGCTPDGITSDISLVAGQWWHVVGVQDTSEFRLFINGVKKTVSKSGTTSDTNGSFAIGKFGDWTDATNYFDGIIDDVAIWNRALTDREVGLLYASNIKKINGISNKEHEFYYDPLLVDANLQGYWRLESDGTDSSGNSKTLTKNGTPSHTSAKFGNGVDLGTSNSTKYLSITDDFGITSGAVSVSMWVKSNTTPTGGVVTTLFERGDSGTDVRHWIRYNDASGTPSLQFNRQRENTANDSFTVGYTIPTDSFSHLVLTYTGTTVYGYINGVKVGSVASSGNGASGVDIDYFYIGAGRSQAGAIQFYSNAVFDDATVFNRALSDAEVLTIYTGKIKKINGVAIASIKKINGVPNS